MSAVATATQEYKDVLLDVKRLRNGSKMEPPRFKKLASIVTALICALLPKAEEDEKARRCLMRLVLDLGRDHCKELFGDGEMKYDFKRSNALMVWLEHVVKHCNVNI